MAPRDLLLGAWEAALAAVAAGRVLPPHLPAPPAAGRTLVLAAGKAAAAMAACVEAHWPATAALTGLAITRHGHGLPLARIALAEAGHPLPDAAGVDAARRALQLVGTAAPADRILALISGGGSSLLSLPADGLTLADLHTVADGLLRAGAPIDEINCVRKHLSATLGGRLAERCRAPVTALLVSDVVGDDASTIASGPFAPDVSSFADALDVLARWRVPAPPVVLDHLRAGAAGRHADTPKPGAACFVGVDHRIVARGRDALDAAADYFSARGIHAVSLGDGITGEAREVARVLAALAGEIRHRGQPWRAPVALLSGGETTVTVRGNGRGGRNGEFLLALALALRGVDGVYALAADSDGIDGGGDNAGALLAPDSLARAAAAGLDARALLDDNDAYRFFAVLDDLVITGPTRTNVNDVRIVLVT
jgi:hydroxypyruvate reductase